MKPLWKQAPFSASTLKVLACVLMLIDHVGLRFFPYDMTWRMIGRLAFPIFAFFIAEGCRYTHNKPKRFFTMLLCGVVFEAVYVCYSGELYGNILLTFSLSILLIYAVQAFKRQLCTGSIGECAVTAAMLAVLLIGAYWLATTFHLDYGIEGVCVAVAVSLFDYQEGEAPTWMKPLDRLSVKLGMLTLSLLWLAFAGGLNRIQLYSLLAVPLLALYNGKPGNRRMKYGFYVFYPLHLVIIELIAVCLAA